VNGLLIIYTLILILVVITCIFSLFSNTSAQLSIKTLHEKTLYMNKHIPSEIKDNSQINIGNKPSAIAVDKNIYVVNRDSNTLSVISTENNTKIKDIPVGKQPTSIGIDGSTDTVYVTNSGSNSVSVIDAFADKVISQVKFNVNPFNSGYIVCDKDNLISPILQNIYLYSGALCTAKPNKGFEFFNWQENLMNNATQLITLSSSPSTWDSILNFFGIKQNKPEATLNITKYGSFTANFKELPPPLPPEYWTTLFGFVLSSIVGAWFVPSFIKWTKSKMEDRKVNHYYQRIINLHDDGNVGDTDIKELANLKNNIIGLYSKGEINNEQYSLLKNEISIRYEQMFSKRIKSLKYKVKYSNEDLLKIEENVIDAYSKGNINELHYNLLKENISKSVNRNDQ
jgi:YVTN family beta-propeller protein